MGVEESRQGLRLGSASNKPWDLRQVLSFLGPHVFKG